RRLHRAQPVMEGAEQPPRRLLRLRRKAALGLGQQVVQRRLDRLLGQGRVLHRGTAIAAQPHQQGAGLLEAQRHRTLPSHPAGFCDGARHIPPWDRFFRSRMPPEMAKLRQDCVRPRRDHQARRRRAPRPGPGQDGGRSRPRPAAPPAAGRGRRRYRG
ncbi:hypothetical protein HMPREF0731_3364, partial [Pseudoroseomonas cervicalis ATCC 49957]